MKNYFIFVLTNLFNFCIKAFICRYRINKLAKFEQIKTNKSYYSYITKNQLMKSKFFALTVAASLFFMACSAIDNLLSFTISNETSVQIKANTLINLPTEISTPDVTTNSSDEFKNNNTQANLVKDVKLKSLNISITNPEGKNFSFLKSIHIYVSTTDTNEIEIAYQDNINSTSNSIDLICTNEKLDQYIKADSYKIRTKVTLKETVSQDVTVKSSMKFRVTADPF